MKLTKIGASKGLTLTVDPGITGTGLALWRNSEWGKISYPIECLNLRPKGSGSWEGRAKDLAERFIDYKHNVEHARLYSVTKVIIEEPKYFADKSEGEMAAKTNSLGKIYMLVGILTMAAWSEGAKVELIRVDKWKGTLSKDIVIQRIKRRLPEIEKRLSPKTHSWDAIGIGLGIQDFLSINTGK